MLLVKNYQSILKFHLKKRQEKDRHNGRCSMGNWQILTKFGREVLHSFFYVLLVIDSGTCIQTILSCGYT